MNFSIANAYVDFSPKNLEKLQQAYEKIKRDGSKAVDHVQKRVKGVSWGSISSGATTAFGKIYSTATGTIKRISSSIFSLRNAFIGLAAGAGVGALVGMFRDYEDAVVAMGRVTKESFDEIKKRVKTLGPDFGTQAELMRGYYNVISAGIEGTTKQMDLLKQSAMMSEVTQIKQAEVVRALAPLMKAYSDELRGASDAADVLYGIEKAGITTVAELIPYIGSLGDLAKVSGLNVYEMGGALAQITTTGIGTGQSVTRLERLLISLSKPTEGLTTLFENYGGALNAIKQIGFVEVLKKIQEATGGAADELQELLGGRAEARMAFISLMKNEFGETYKNIDKVKDSAGLANKAFDDWGTTLSKMIGDFKNAFINDMVVLVEQNADRIKDALAAMKDWMVENVDTFVRAGKAIAGAINLATEATKWYLDYVDRQVKKINEADDAAERYALTHGKTLKSAIMFNLGLWKDTETQQNKLIGQYGVIGGKISDIANVTNKSAGEAQEYWEEAMSNATYANDKYTENTNKNTNKIINMWKRKSRELTEEEQRLMEELTNIGELYYEEGMDFSSKNIAQARYESDQIISAAKERGRSLEEIDQDAIDKMMRNAEIFGELYYEEQEEMTAKHIAETRSRTDAMIKEAKDANNTWKKFGSDIKWVFQSTFEGSFTDISNMWNNLWDNMANYVKTNAMKQISDALTDKSFWGNITDSLGGLFEEGGMFGGIVDSLKGSLGGLFEGDGIFGGLGDILGGLGGFLDPSGGLLSGLLGMGAGWLMDSVGGLFGFGKKTKYEEISGASISAGEQGFEFERFSANEYGADLAAKANAVVNKQLKTLNEKIVEALEIATPEQAEQIRQMMESANFKDALSAVYSSGFQGFSISEKTKDRAAGLKQILDHIENNFTGATQGLSEFVDGVVGAAEQMEVDTESAARKVSSVKEISAWINQQIKEIDDYYNSIIEDINSREAERVSPWSSLKAQVQGSMTSRERKDWGVQEYTDYFNKLINSGDDSIEAMQEQVEILEKIASLQEQEVASTKAIVASLEGTISTFTGGSMASVQSQSWYDQKYMQMYSKAIGGDIGAGEEFNKFVNEYANFMQSTGANYDAVVSEIVRDLEAVKDVFANKERELATNEMMMQTSLSTNKLLEAIIHKADEQIAAIKADSAAQRAAAEAARESAKGAYSGDWATVAVENLYSDILGRASDQAGLAGWTQALRSGAMSYEDVKQGFYGSEEYLSKFGQSGGLMTSPTIGGEHGPEWFVPTYEPEKSKFLQDVGVSPEKIGKEIARALIASAPSSGGSSKIQIVVKSRILGEVIAEEIENKNPRLIGALSRV